MRIACLHTATSNIALFDRTAAELQLETGILHHVVQSELLLDAENQGSVTPEIAARTLEILVQLATQADALLLNCSTLGPIADQANMILPIPVVRSDRALAQQALLSLEAGQRLTVLCTAPTTLEATSQLFTQVFTGSATMPDTLLVQGAWALFRAGEMDAYYQLIADASDAAYQSGSALVAFAQTSMTDSAKYTRSGQTPLDVPKAALHHILQLV